MKLAGRVAVITGAASGIGLASAKLFAAEGAKLALVDRNEEALARAAEALPQALILCGDVSDEAMVALHARKTMIAFGRMDVLVTAAGISNGKAAPDCSLEDWQAVLAVNLTGTFLWAREAVRAMRQIGSGSIVMIASQLAFAGGRNNAAYIASKGAVVSLAQTMALDHAAENIRVNSIAPGAIDTPLLARSFGLTDDPAAARSRSLARHPLGRFGRAEEVAKAALFLASEDASFTTGSCLRVDGGWLAG